MFSPVLADASFTRSPTVILSSLMYGCSSRQTSEKNLLSLPSTIFSTIAAGFLSLSTCAAKISRSLRDALRRARPRAARTRRPPAATCIARLRTSAWNRRARHEVGLAVDLDQHADAAARVDVRLDQAFAGGAARALLGLRDAALAQRVDRLRRSRRASRPAPSCTPSCPRRSARGAASPARR